eukprot:gene19138-19503_t
MATLVSAAIRQPSGSSAAFVLISRRGDFSSRREGEKLVDQATGETKHYQARADRIRFTGIFAPPDAPAWVHDRNALWNAAERAERRRDATLAREIVLALPHEMTDTQRLWLVQDFVREAFLRRCLVADVAIHAPDRNSDSRNHHAHILITERAIGPDGFASMKDRSSYSKATLRDWRQKWAQLCNRHLGRHGSPARVDHRSLAAQGVDRCPTRHRGHVATQRMRRADTLRQVTAGAARETVRRSTTPKAFRGTVRAVCAPAAMSAAPIQRTPAVTALRVVEDVFQERAAERQGHGFPEQAPESFGNEAEIAQIFAKFSGWIDLTRRENRPRAEIEDIIRALRKRMKDEISFIGKRARDSA